MQHGLDLCLQAVGLQEKDQQHFLLAYDVLPGKHADSDIIWFEGYCMAKKGGILKGVVFVTESLDRP